MACPLGTKPLPKPMLSKIHDVIQHYEATMRPNVGKTEASPHVYIKMENLQMTDEHDTPTSTV